MPGNGAIGRLPELLILDREGVLLEHVDPYILTHDDVRPLAGSLEAVAGFASSEVDVAVVTNQSPIGRGLVTRGFVDEVNAMIEQSLAARGVERVAFYVCPHTPVDGCVCRKPGAGMLEWAAHDAGAMLDRSWMVGDQDSDMLAALTAGCAQRIQVMSGVQGQATSHATLVVQDLRALARRCGIGL